MTDEGWYCIILDMKKNMNLMYVGDRIKKARLGTANPSRCFEVVESSCGRLLSVLRWLPVRSGGFRVGSGRCELAAAASLLIQAAEKVSRRLTSQSGWLRIYSGGCITIPATSNTIAAASKKLRPEKIHSGGVKSFTAAPGLKIK